jgi:hypothetical protein
MPPKFQVLILGILLVGCHSANQQPGALSAAYDSSNVTPGGKDQDPAGRKSRRDSIEAQILAPDSIFEDGSRPTTWVNAGFNNPEGFKRFLLVYQHWIRKDQVDSISAHIRYPIRGAGSAAWFKEQYPRIFTHRIKTIILRQRLDRIFRNGQGAMIGNGDVWFVEEKGRYWVTAIN